MTKNINSNERRVVKYPERGQLFVLIPKMALYDRITNRKIVTKSGDNMPFMKWPGGRPCLPANLYLLHIRENSGRKGQGPSRLGTKGGTFGEYATQISHLIRFCYYNKLDFIAMSDDDFYEFIEGLRDEKRAGSTGESRRTERTITAIGRRCLHFLAYMGNFHDRKNFVGVDGTISIQLIESTHYLNGKPVKRTSVHHRSFRPVSARKTRRPITEGSIQKLRDAIDEMSTSDFLCERRHLMISLFEETGARRGEIRPIKVREVLAAAAMDAPKLLVTTLKKGEHVTRELPISAPLINELLGYIRGSRRTLVKANLRHDHGYVFVAERGAHALVTDTLTTEFSKIRRHAGIEVQACAHMFRHAFCTMQVAALIAELQSESPESFRQTILTNKMVAEHAMSLTGHATLESLLEYVDDAFRHQSKFAKVISNVHAQFAYESYEKRRKRLIQRHRNNQITNEQLYAEDAALTAARDKDLEIASKRVIDE